MIGAIHSWLTEEKRSTYGLAGTRIVLGFIVSTQLLINWPDRHYTWGTGTQWAEPARDLKSWPQVLTDTGTLAFDVVYVFAILAGISLMVGFASRASAALALVLWMALYVTNPFVGSGGDAVLRMVLLYVCFTDSGRRWSVDDWLRRRRGDVRSLVPGWLSNLVHNVALVLIIHQVIMVYVGSALWKVQSEQWMSGKATYYPLQVEAYSPWRDFIEPLSTSGPIVMAATWSAIALQLFFPLLLIYKPTRVLALVAITGMHLGIGFGMGILFFSLVMIAVDLLLVSDATWDEAARRVRRLLRRSETTEPVEVV